jgi:hypothetical protein
MLDRALVGGLIPEIQKLKEGENNDDTRTVYTHAHAFTHLQRPAEKPDEFLVLLCWQSLWVCVVGRE